MAEQLNDKVAVITGAGRGIGRALAIGFAGQGAKVVCTARTQAQIDEVAGLIQEAGGSALSLVCDVTNAASVERVYDITRQTYGRLDIVIANLVRQSLEDSDIVAWEGTAGGNLVRQSLEDSDIVAWEGTIRLNLIGVYYTAKFAIPYLKAEGGHIIVVGSGVGHRVADNTHSAYGASKAGAWMLTRALARELSQYSICVNELIPGLVATDLTSNMSRPPDSPLRAEWKKAPEDVVPLAIFIASQPLTGPTGQSFSLMRRDSQ